MNILRYEGFIGYEGPPRYENISEYKGILGYESISRYEDILGHECVVIGEADAFQFPILRLTPSGSRSSPFKAYPFLKNHLPGIIYCLTDGALHSLSPAILRLIYFILFR